MTEFWEESFKEKQAMWGHRPADSAIETARLFRENGLGKILIPGFGYGRNALPFLECGLDVTGIEISETAIDLAKAHISPETKIHHGSVADMPFDREKYDGIFCYALIHLLRPDERSKLIKDCYGQLREGGLMVFTAISKTTPAYGQGQEMDDGTFITPHGVMIYYYDLNAITAEFGSFGLMDSREINEPAKQTPGKAIQKFWLVVCRKNAEPLKSGN